MRYLAVLLLPVLAPGPAAEPSRDEGGQGPLLDGVAHAGDLAMLDAVAAREEAQPRVPHRVAGRPQAVHLEALREARRLLDHPPQRDVGQAGLGLDVAAADVRVVPGEPDLDQLLGQAGVARRCVDHRPPRHAREVLAALVDGDGGAGVADMRAQEPVEVRALPLRQVRADVALVREVADRLGHGGAPRLQDPPGGPAEEADFKQDEGERRPPEWPSRDEMQEAGERRRDEDAREGERDRDDGADGRLDGGALGPRDPEGGDGVEGPDEVGRHVRAPVAVDVVRPVPGPEAAGEFLALSGVALARVTGAMLQHGVDRLPGDVARGLAEQGQRGAVGHAGRDAAERQQVGDTPHGVGAPAEADQEDAVARRVVVDDESVAVRHVGRDAASGHGGQQLLDEPDGRRHRGRTDVGAEAGVVEGNLLARIDGAVRPDAAGPVELVDVAQPLLRPCAAVLTGTVREDHDVLGHGPLPHPERS